MPKRNNKVYILLSSYNGETFILEQLNSLVKLVDVEPYIIIRDDGSSDKTISIIKDFKTLYPKILTLIEGKNIGWKKSFFELLKYANQYCLDSDFFAFCDQDDIWLPEKLSKAIKHLKELPDNSPCLYCSNLYYYKDNKNYGLIRNASNIQDSFKSCLIENFATGCTIVFNRKLLSILNIEHPSFPIAHDYWTYMVATLCGYVYIDNESYILYRQHRHNQIGSKNGFFDIWKRRLYNILHYKKTISRQKISIELQRIFSAYMHTDALQAVSKIADYNISLCNKLSLFFDNEFKFKKISNNFWLRLRILIGNL